MSKRIRPSIHPGARLASEAATVGDKALSYVLDAIANPGASVSVWGRAYDIRYHARIVAREAASAARQAFRRGYPRPSRTAP